MSAANLTLLILAILSMLLFFPLNTRVGRSRTSPLVRYIPFIPAFILAYLALFPFVTFTLFAVLPFSNIATHLYVSLIFGGLVSAVIWYFWPTTVEQRPTPIGDDTFSRLTRWTYARDPRSNAFPSSHATTALICSYYLAHAYPPFAIIVWSLCIFIVSATLFIKQHHLIDLISGGILALIAILFSILVMIY